MRGFVQLILVLMIAALPGAASADGIEVTLLGTGDPTPRIDRFGPATLIRSEGATILVDAGRGVMQRLSQIGVPTAELDAILITHLHSDHLVGLPDLLLTGWVVERRTRPLQVYGPPGTRDMLEKLEAAFSFDIDIRSAEAGLDRKGASVSVTEIETGFSLDLGNLVVTAFDVDHSPVRPALGFRFDAGELSVGLSGDTRYSPSLIAALQGVDLVVHEVVGASSDVLERRPSLPRVLHHTRPAELARVLTATSPRLAVLTHLVLVGDYDPGQLVPEIQRDWNGPVVLGSDLMRIHVGKEITVLPSLDRERHIEELLRTRDAHRVAHRTEDLDLWLESLAEPLRSVEGGTVSVVTHGDFDRRMSAYFEAVDFLGWEDLEVPVVRMSDDDSRAEVIVRKRVDTAGENGPASSTTFAWTEGWRRHAGGWLMESITSTRGDELAGEPEADSLLAILERSRAYLGGKAVLEVPMTRFSADCTGPNGDYTTEVVSARDGRFRFEQIRPDRPDFGLGRSLQSSWGTGADGSIRTANLEGRLMHVVAGHEWPLVAIAPEARYRAPRLLGRGSLAGVPTDVVGWTDPLGGEVSFHYGEDGRPIGFVLEAHDDSGAPIETIFSEWTDVAGVKLPGRVEITQGTEDFVCTMQSLATGWFPDATFRAGLMP